MLKVGVIGSDFLINKNREILQEKNWKVKAHLKSDGTTLEGWNTETKYISSNKATTEGRRADIASDIDQIFVARYNQHSSEENTAITVQVAGGPVSSLDNLKHNPILHYTHTRSVEYFYNLLDINYLILYFGGFMTLMALIKASMGLILRLYKATALFIISPGVTALTPIDDGNAYKQWRKAFISNVLGAYGFVIAMNLLFLLLGIIDNISLDGVDVILNRKLLEE